MRAAAMAIQTVPGLRRGRCDPRAQGRQSSGPPKRLGKLTCQSYRPWVLPPHLPGWASFQTTLLDTCDSLFVSVHGTTLARSPSEGGTGAEAYK